uniref:Transmembrane protein n=1 Tax=Caenorhabditis tropicalis TaxID=1561998 RepID=A0A1I7TWF6_9PELO
MGSNKKRLCSVLVVSMYTMGFIWMFSVLDGEKNFIRFFNFLIQGISISRRVGLILHICLIPLTVTMILVSSLAVFTRVMRKQTAILILILISWITLSTLIATVVLRRIINTSSTTVITFDYQYHWQIYITLASFIIAFLLTQIFAFGGYFRPMITMLSFDGHYQRYDYPRMSKLERNMVSVKELDNF